MWIPNIDFMEYMEDESVYWMDAHHEPSAENIYA